jgi:hypothetical protein
MQAIRLEQTDGKLISYQVFGIGYCVLDMHTRNADERNCDQAPRRQVLQGARESLYYMGNHWSRRMTNKIAEGQESLMS